MLFSEPKIPQCVGASDAHAAGRRFSALQRAENSSMVRLAEESKDCRLFQCSSASRKFLNRVSEEQIQYRVESFSALQRAENSSIAVVPAVARAVICGFSALQRAENSSIQDRRVLRAGGRRFQCSSASRKFLNRSPISPVTTSVRRFSALQRAENSSITKRNQPRELCGEFQCSSASRKFLNSSLFICSFASARVSVLFSEPKIPQ